MFFLKIFPFISNVKKHLDLSNVFNIIEILLILLFFLKLQITTNYVLDSLYNCYINFLKIVINQPELSLEKGKPIERLGRKATDLSCKYS
jgi:hypothetical protein